MVDLIAFVQVQLLEVIESSIIRKNVFKDNATDFGKGQIDNLYKIDVLTCQNEFHAFVADLHLLFEIELFHSS